MVYTSITICNVCDTILCWVAVTANGLVVGTVRILTQNFNIKTIEEIAQWVIDNRYPKSENNKVSDAEMYHTLIEAINQVLHQPLVSGVCTCTISQCYEMNGNYICTTCNKPIHG